MGHLSRSELSFLLPRHCVGPWLQLLHGSFCRWLHVFGLHMSKGRVS